VQTPNGTIHMVNIRATLPGPRLRSGQASRAKGASSSATLRYEAVQGHPVVGASDAASSAAFLSNSRVR